MIPLSLEERRTAEALIRELDERGMRLLRKIGAEWPLDPQSGEANEFVYFSEGLISPFPVPGD